MPVYNEAACLRAVCLEWLEAIRPVPSARLLVVNDGSTDESASILKELEAAHEELIVIHQENGGHGAAIRRGYLAAIERGGEWIFQVDSDGQFRAGDWLKLWARRDRSEFILGTRQDRKDSAARRLLSAAHRALIALVFQVRLRDPNAPFRLMKGSFLARLLEIVPASVFAPNVFLSILSRKLGQPLCEAPVEHLPRRAGPGSIHWTRLLPVMARCARELALFRLQCQGRIAASSTPVEERDFLSEYLRRGPIFAALLRAVECRLVRQCAPLPEPLVDLGCGDGLFASLAFDQAVFAGLDPDRAALGRAAREGAHGALVCGSATALPFRDSCLATVLANSVLEHIPDIDAAVKECFRVLRPGGRFVVTAPSHKFAEMLGGTSLLRRLGLRFLATAYGRWFNWHSLHFHTDSEQDWRLRLERRGFEVERSRYYLTPAALGAFDLAHYLSVPRLVSRKLTGRWVACPPLSLNRLWRRWLEKHYRRREAEGEGPYVFVLATKPETARPQATTQTAAARDGA